MLLLALTVSGLFLKGLASLAMVFWVYYFLVNPCLVNYINGVSWNNTIIGAKKHKLDKKMLKKLGLFILWFFIIPLVTMWFGFAMTAYRWPLWEGVIISAVVWLWYVYLWYRLLRDWKKSGKLKSEEKLK